MDLPDGVGTSHAGLNAKQVLSQDSVKHPNSQSLQTGRILARLEGMLCVRGDIRISQYRGWHQNFESVLVFIASC